MPRPGSFEVLGEEFWENDEYSMPLHAKTVLQRIRDDLSRGRPTPITVNGVWEIAQREMGYTEGQCFYAQEEVARPLLVIGAVWAHKAHGISLERAQAMGGLLSAFVADDALLGGPSFPAERKLWKEFETWLRGRSRLNWRETGEAIDFLLHALR